jgi:serine/threonine protein kinase
MAADASSCGCLAYVGLSGETLFDAPNEVALISAHLVHDGMPAPVKRLADKPATSALAGLLRKCLRKSPDDRASVAQIRAELEKLGATIATRSWPVPVS